MMHLLILLVMAVTSSSKRLDMKGDFVPRFAPKTSYFVNVSSDIRNPVPPGCSPVLFWHLARHGTRYFGSEDNSELARDLPKIKDRLIVSWLEGRSELGLRDNSTISNLILWKFNFTGEDNKQLADAGRREHREMGERWRKRLQDVINWDLNRTEVYASNKQRCLESGRSFMDGLFGTQLPIQEDNHLLKFYNDCEKYVKEVKKNDDIDAEAEIFEKTEPFFGIQKNIKDKTGVNLTRNEIEQVWEICRFEMAWYPGKWSPWCSIFSPQDLQAFDFREDLIAYYLRGYGHKITWQATQPLWRDLISRLEEIQMTGGAENNTVLLFGHSGTIQPFLVSLGLFKDSEHLMASDWPAEDRAWRTSDIVTFAANLDLMVLECNAQDGSEGIKDKTTDLPSDTKKFQEKLFCSTRRG